LGYGPMVKIFCGRQTFPLHTKGPCRVRRETLIGPICTSDTHHYKQESSSRLPVGVIVITPPRSRDSHQRRPPRKTSLQRPHEACAGLSQTDDSSHRRLAALILTMNSEEEKCNTHVEENHHDWTAHHRASSPQVQPHPQL
jgi:hypothetical protein